MLEQDKHGEHLVLLDFGSARTFVSNESRTMTGVVTAGYSPQEQYSQKSRQGPYTDVYALCATMYHAITGALPPASIERALEGVQLKSFEECGVPVPQTVEHAIVHGLALKSTERTQTMGELLEELNGEDAEDSNEDKTKERSAKRPPVAKVSESKPISRPNQQGETSAVQPVTETQRKSEKKPSALPKLLAGVAAGVLLVTGIYFGILKNNGSSEVKLESTTETVTVSTDSASVQTSTPTPTSDVYEIVVQYSNGVYEGELKDGKENGKGKYTWTDGDVYEGEFVDGKMTGWGTYKWPDGAVYEGEFVDGKLTGRGKKTYSSGDVYEGEWKDDKWNGKGKYTWTEGDVYEGEWKDDKRTGWGTYKWPNGDVYEGEFVDGKQTGWGIYKKPDGSVYEGQWKNGDFIG